MNIEEAIDVFRYPEEYTTTDGAEAIETMIAVAEAARDYAAAWHEFCAGIPAGKDGAKLFRAKSEAHGALLEVCDATKKKN